MGCALLVGCGQEENVLAILDHVANSRVQQAVKTDPLRQTSQKDSMTLEWGFTEDTQVCRLPQVCSGQTPFVGLPGRGDVSKAQPEMLGILLAPIDCSESINDSIPPLAEVRNTPESPLKVTETQVEVAEIQAEVAENQAELVDIHAEATQSRAIVAAASEDYSPEERTLLDVIARDRLSVSTGAQTDLRLDQQSREKIGAAFVLAQRGASYAARQELIEVLRLISQAKDNREATRIRSESLAVGMRSLEEAEDFVPRGTQLEAEMALEVICASHRTPLAKEADFATVLPSQMMDRYYRYAQIKLALAVAGEPAGSMALYSLGKLYKQLGEVESEKHRMATRKAVAFQQAALLAHNQNYLAAHELGVLLAETGHLDEARQLLDQVARREPNAVVFRNLARVYQELKEFALANECRMHADVLVQQGRGPAAQVAWVAPEQFSQSPPSSAPPQIATRPMAPTARY